MTLSCSSVVMCLPHLVQGNWESCTILQHIWTVHHSRAFKTECVLVNLAWSQKCSLQLVSTRKWFISSPLLSFCSLFSLPCLLTLLNVLIALAFVFHELLLWELSLSIPLFFLCRTVLRSFPPPKSTSLLEWLNQSHWRPKTCPSRSLDKGTTSASSTFRERHTVYLPCASTARPSSARKQRWVESYKSIWLVKWMHEGK